MAACWAVEVRHEHFWREGYIRYRVRNKRRKRLRGKNGETLLNQQRIFLERSTGASCTDVALSSKSFAFVRLFGSFTAGWMCRCLSARIKRCITFTKQTNLCMTDVGAWSRAGRFCQLSPCSVCTSTWCDVSMILKAWYLFFFFFY